MQKTITYTSFIVASLVVILLFVTAKNYTQLGLAVVLYPALAYMVLNIVPRRKRKHPEIAIQLPSTQALTEVADSSETKTTRVDVADIDKRAFLKLIGVAGFSIFLSSLLGRKASGLFSGRITGSDTTALEDTAGNKINPVERQPMDGYQISEIDDNIVSYYGFTNKDGSWFIMREDTDASSFRYTKGDASFTDNWNNRENLKYDYFHNVF